MKIARTTNRPKGVLYEVYESETKKVVWARYIPFGKNKRNRAGGPAFVEAAHTQEQACSSNPRSQP
jgi:hypothetical protein